MFHLLKNSPSMLFRGFLSIFIFLVVCTEGGAQCACTDCRCADSLELVKLYNATNGDNWTNKTNWKVVGQPINTWYGISMVNGRVACIDLDGIADFNGGNFTATGNNLRGILPSLRFSALTFLDLDTNKGLKGDLPAMTLPEITLIGLGGDSLTGTIPSSWNFPKLQYLAICCNQLNGTLPTLNFPQLLGLYLQNNKLNGALPTINAPLLADIHLNNNQLIGCFPASYRQFCTIPQAFQRDFSQNAGLPNNGDFAVFCSNSMGICQDTTTCRYKDSLALTALYRQNMQNVPPQYKWKLDSPMTTWYGVVLNAQGCVECLDLDGDASVCNGWSVNPPGVGLSGNFPSAIGQLTSLYRLHLRGNRNLTGSIPDSIRYLTNLAAMYVDSCGLSGALPDGFRYLTNLIDFTGYKTSFNAPLSDVFGNIKKMDTFSMYETGTLDTFPSSLANVDSLRRIYLGRNKMKGKIPAALGNRLLHYIDFEDNDFDSLPPLKPTVWNLTYIEPPTMKLQGNRFTFDDIVPTLNVTPAAFTKTYAPQDSVFVDTTIRATVGHPLSIDLKFDAAMDSNVYRWYKNGNTTTVWRTVTGVNKLIFNNLQAADAGTYEVWITNPKAPLLTLKSRKITIIAQPNTTCRYRDSLVLIDIDRTTNGRQWVVRNNPNAVSPWDTLKRIDSWHGVIVSSEGCVIQLSLNHNGLTGTLPTTLDSLKELNFLSLSNNQIGGSIPSNIGSLSKLTVLDLSYNNFTGSLPPSLGNLRELVLCYLGENPSLTGAIPPSFGNLTKVEDLFINQCDLTGKIPAELGNMTNLKKMLLSGNRLSDTLPANLGNLRNMKTFSVDNNLLTGKIPVSFRNLSSLVCLIFNNNQIDSVPNLSNLAQLDTGCLSAYINRLTFDDVVPNQRPNALRFSHSYHQQDSVFETITIRQAQNTPLSIDLKFDATMSGNVYRWNKNGSFWRTENGINKLIFNSLQTTDAGVYDVQVTNPKAPNLTLQSKKITIEVLPPTCTGTKTTRRDSFCNGATFTFLDNSTTTTTGVFEKILRGANGCSDTTIYTLSFRQNLKTTKRDSFCSGTTYTFLDNSTTTTAGVFTKIGRGVNGCSDTTIYNLTLQKSLKINRLDSFCKGMTYVFPDNSTTQIAGNFQKIGRGANGCFDTTNFTLNHKTLRVRLLNQKFCDSFRLPTGRWVKTAGVYRDSVRCDSIVEITLENDLVCGGIPRISTGINLDDLTNCCLQVESLDKFPRSQLLIYNTWNELVFRSNIPYDNQWNGRNQRGEPLPTGTYYYQFYLDTDLKKRTEGFGLIIRP